MARMNVSFECPECGGRVTSHRGPGRKRQLVRGAPEFDVPEDLDIPQCKQCGEEYPLPEYDIALHAALELQYCRWRAQHLDNLVSYLTGKHGITLTQVAGLCDISLPKLQRLHDSTQMWDGSLGIVRLLEALAADDTTCERILKGIPMETSCLR